MVNKVIYSVCTEKWVYVFVVAIPYKMGHEVLHFYHLCHNESKFNLQKLPTLYISP